MSGVCDLCESSNEVKDVKDTFGEKFPCCSKCFHDMSTAENKLRPMTGEEATEIWSKS